MLSRLISEVFLQVQLPLIVVIPLLLAAVALILLGFLMGRHVRVVSARLGDDAGLGRVRKVKNPGQPVRSLLEGDEFMEALNGTVDEARRELEAGKRIPTMMGTDL